MSEAFVSVITPVYNGETYLEQCIKSILAQTHDNFEYIVCNNHSKDRSGEIAADYAAKDARIRVVKPPTFVPQAKNFNFALQQIAPNSAYTKMLFADDWLYPQCIDALSSLALAHPSVGLVSSYRLIETTPDGFGLPADRQVFSGREAARAHLFGTAYAFGNPSVVLYRSDLVRARAPAFFGEHLLNFDLDIGFRLLEKHDFGFVHQVLSFSRYQAGAITHGITSYNPWFLSRYMEVLEFGRTFLEPAEYEECLAQVTKQFYEGLGDVWLKERLRRRRREEFWKFQTSQLSSIGAELHRSELYKGIAGALVNWFGNPAGVVRSARDSLDRRGA